ncbi:MFS transporter [Legionella gresilensis]|uniref:MFS transporter n=1 Tax=Legionella gresilensis TaxID=91823 RepID=UPI00104139E9|nr:MFS transporter [Legionella gresilensis]
MGRMIPKDERASLSKLILPGILGNILEWYDFSLYGYFAPIIAKLFFPTSDKLLSLLATFGVFATGFIMRPIGALLFGYFGDRNGRKKTLAASIILMAIPTTLIGLLPTYQQMGIFAGILLLICRLLQGLAVGGEFCGSIVYITEHSPANRRGMFGSWAMFSAFAGLLLGSGVTALFNALLSQQDLISWGWRIPFIAGLLLGAVGLYFRLRMPETPNFVTIKNRQQILINPVNQAFKVAAQPMVISTALVFLPAMSFYLLFVYLPSYMTEILGMSLHRSLTINTISMLVIILVIPLIGLLSDIIGRKPVLLTGAIGFGLLSYPLFLLIQHTTFISVLLAQVMFAILVSFAYAAIPATLVELVGTNIRYTAMSFPYNLSNAVFGGTAPLVATYLIEKTNNPLAPSFYLIFAAMIMFFVVPLIQEGYKKSLQ